MAYILVFLASWTILLLLARKDQFAALYSTVLIAVVLSLSSNVVTNYFPLWEYGNRGSVPQVAVDLLDDFGIYPMIAYLYLQQLPKKVSKWIAYTFIWTLGGICVESILVDQGYMVHHLGWSLGWSYASNWLIFAILAVHHVWMSRRLHRPAVVLEQSGVAYISLKTGVYPLPADHPLHNLPDIPGIKMFQSASKDNFETFLFIIEPGAQMPTHFHEGYEVHFVVEGSVSITVNNREIHLQQGELYHFPSSEPHTFQSASNSPAKLICALFREQLPVSSQDRLSKAF